MSILLPVTNYILLVTFTDLRSAINDRVKFILDTCVDAAGTVIEEFNAEFGAGSINIPTNFDTEVDGEGRDSLTKWYRTGTV